MNDIMQYNKLLEFIIFTNLSLTFFENDIVFSLSFFIKNAPYMCVYFPFFRFHISSASGKFNQILLECERERDTEEYGEV